MTKKLMKYDIKNMMKILVYIYAISLGLAVITRLINIGKDMQVLAILGHIFAGLTYSAIASIIVNTFVHILKVFTNGFYKDESYLTHTLPVTKDKLLLSKYLSALIVIFISVAVSIASIAIMHYTSALIEGLKAFITTAISGFNMSVGVFLLLLGAIIFSQISSIMSMAFCAIVKAYTYNSKRVLRGLIFFAVIYFVSMYITLIVVAIIFAINGNISHMFASVLTQGEFLTILIIGLVCYVLYAIVYYFICAKMFRKGVNVD